MNPLDRKDAAMSKFDPSRWEEVVDALNRLAFARSWPPDIRDIQNARALICEIKGVKPATEPSPLVRNDTHG